MNLIKLFEDQKVVRDKIITTKKLEGRDLLPNLILALRVELGELANEQRTWKHWSEDKEPRIVGKCSSCTGEGKGYFSGEKWTGSLEECMHCLGTGEDRSENPLLEEYADCLSFTLELSLELGIEAEAKIEEILYSFINKKNITQMFNQTFLSISDLEIVIKYHYTRKNAVIGEYNALLTNLITLGFLLGFDYEEIENAYYAKNKVNLVRQDSGY